MSYLVLARKWRPKRFQDLTGQDVIVRTLKNALTSNHLAHAYLITGIRGVGKTTISRLMAMAVNCTAAHDGEPCGSCEPCLSITAGNNLDVQEMDAASHTGVDDIREILDNVRYPPVHLKIKVYIIDEAHMLSKPAFNALLKTLEEPPENVLFILATTESDKLPITVRSRCQRFDLRRLNVTEITDYLAYILKQEAVATQTAALQLIARAADGSVRDALSLTERVLAFSSKDISLESVQQSLGLIGSAQTEQLADAILSGNANQAIQTLRQARELGVSPAHLLKTLSEYLHEMMCCKLSPSLIPQSISPDTQQWLLQHATCWDSEALDIRYQALIHGLKDISLMDEQRGAEIVVMRLSHLCKISPPLKKIEKKTLKNKRIIQGGRPQETATNTQADEQQAAKPNKKTRKHEPTPTPQSWKEAMQQYHKVKPGIAAILEHVLCQSFDKSVCLLLNQHQLDALNKQERQHFEHWLQRDITWLTRTNETGESLLETQQREANEYTQVLWQQAKADPNVQALQSALGCRLRHVRPPRLEPSINDSSHSAP